MVDATDSAKVRAEELGVNLDDVQGSGQDGRILVSDVEAAASGIDASEAEEQFMVRLNPATGLGGYAFDADFAVLADERYRLTREQYEKYSDKHNGLRVIVKA